MMKQLLRTLAMAATACAAAAQPIPKLKSISQEYIQRGSTVEVDDRRRKSHRTRNSSSAANRVCNSNSSAASEPDDRRRSQRRRNHRHQQKRSEQNRGDVGRERNAALGAREIRLASARRCFESANAHHFTHLPEFIGAATAMSLEKAQELPLPFAVTAKIGAAAQSDFYKFKASKGQHVILEVLAQRLGSPLDSSLAVLHKNGRELARNEDAIGNDSVLDFQAPEDGEYIAQVRDYRLQGGDKFDYRLLAGTLPYVRAAFPFAGRRGDTTEVELRGFNLQGAEKMTLRLDATTRLGQQDLRTTSPAGLSNPFAFIVSDLSELLESEPNTSVTHANAISLPAAINGRIQAAKDYDAFKFHVEKDQRWILKSPRNVLDRRSTRCSR
jgi:hypothetical protein